MNRIIGKSDADFAARVGALVDRAATIPEHIETAARDVIRAVRKGGDAAIRELTQRFEKRTLTALELPRAEWEAIASRVDARTRGAIERAAARIRAYPDRERNKTIEQREP